MGADMQLRVAPGAVFTTVAFALAGGLSGMGIRVLLSRLRRGARVPVGGCETGLAALWSMTGAGWTSGLIPGNRVPLLLGVGWLAVAAGSVDLLHRRLPDALTLPAVPIGLLLLTPLGPAAVGRGCAGAATGLAVYATVHLLAPADLGAGDVKLAGALGAVLAGLSWSALAVAAIVSALLSAAVALAAVLRSPTRRVTAARDPPDAPQRGVRMTVPHGPPMLAAGWLVVWLAA